MIKVHINSQKLWHRRTTGVWHCYPISTAKAGRGNRQGSWQTPHGRHRVAALIGADEPIFTAFVARQPVGIYLPNIDSNNKDWILSRIIRLRGDQTGINRRGHCDSFQRYIYIHGTHDEATLGTPASHGCIRMANDDIIELFKYCRLAELVYIS